MKNHTYTDNISVYSMAQIICGLLMVTYTMLAVRMLDLSEYGLFQAVMGLYAIIFVFGFPLNVATLHCVGNAPNHKKGSALEMCLRLSAIIGVVCFCFVVFFSKKMALLFHSDSRSPFIAMGCLLCVSFLLTVFYGGLQGRNEYGIYSYSKISEVTISFCAGALLMFFDLGVAGAVSGYLTGMIIVTGIFLFRMKHSRSKKQNIGVYQEIKSLILPLAVACTLFFTSCYPMIIARIRLPENISGVFGSLFAVKNILQPFALAVSLPLYSRIISNKNEPGMVKKALVIISIISFCYIIVSLICPDIFIQIIFGTNYIPASEYLFLYGINLTLYMFNMVVLFFQSAKGTLDTRLLVIPIILILSLSFLPNIDIDKIIIIQIMAWGILLTGLTINFQKERAN